MIEEKSSEHVASYGCSVDTHLVAAGFRDYASMNTVPAGSKATYAVFQVRARQSKRGEVLRGMRDTADAHLRKVRWSAFVDR
jgi:hypothetical protein